MFYVRIRHGTLELLAKKGSGKSYCRNRSSPVSHPNQVSRAFSCVTKIASMLRDTVAISEGKHLHRHIIQCGLQQNTFLGNLLVQMYGKFGALEEAREVFDAMTQRNLFSWNIMIVAYAQEGQLDAALNLFSHMPQRDVFSWTAMVSGYAQNGQLQQALWLFEEMPERNIVSWNAIISAYAQKGQLDDAFLLFQQMPQKDVFSWTIMISAHSQLGKIDEAFWFFQQMPHRNVVSWNAMISAYAQVGKLENAIQLFQQMPSRNIASWNAMIAAYAQHERVEESTNLFWLMQLEGMKPNQITFVNILDACGKQSALCEGRLVHKSILHSGFELDIVLQICLIDMYAKSGSLGDAYAIFKNVHKKKLHFTNLLQFEVVLWTAIIGAFASYGHAKEALGFLQQMYVEGVKPNAVTFCNVLSACDHGGLLNNGLHCFVSMNNIHEPFTKLEHYASVINLLGRAGQLEEAAALINSMPVQPKPSLWAVFLGSCWTSGHMKHGLNALEHVLDLNPETAGTYVLLSNICAAAGQFEDVE